VSRGPDDGFAALYAAAHAARVAGDLATADALYGRAFRLRPGDPDCAYEYGSNLIELGDPDRACLVLNTALAADPTNLKIASGLGTALRAAERHALAEGLWRTIAVARPGQAQVHYELGQSLLGLARPEEAVPEMRRALALVSPAETAMRDAVWKAYLLALAYADGIAPEFARAENVRRAAELGPPVPPAPAHANPPDPERRLRVGYVTSDLRNHSVARTIEALFAWRDRDRFEAVVYAEDRRADAVTGHFRELADGWVSTAGLDDATVAARVRADAVDVLVVSASHFDENRLGVALFRPAPVQLSIYDSATSGTDAFDGLVVDPVMVPRGAAWTVERPLRTRRMYYHPPLDLAPPVGRPPVRANGFVTFGSANHPSKFSRRTFALWAAALRAVPGSRLRLKSGRRYEDPATREAIARRFADSGVELARIDFDRGDRDMHAHLEFYNRIDVALDTTPFNGATTTFESLWMGVPVVALAGGALMARWAAAVLARIGRPQWAAEDEAGYAVLARRLADEAPAQDRAGLRAVLAGSAVCDARGHARDYERLYRALWRRWCRRTG
jgi:predicted O-linked N-acetylglucosamine transferase (SPINDLY family)